MKTRIFTLLVLALLVATSCSDDDTSQSAPLGDYDNGILIVNEGNFGAGNSSISFVSQDLLTVEHTIFSNVNNKPLGDTAQSIVFYNNLAYIILNLSNTIEVVNRYTFESLATIDTGLNNPRYMTFLNGKGYVTNWGDGNVATDDYLAVIDLETNTIDAQTIPVAEGPERIITEGNSIYVAHKGGYNQNNIISVVNSATNTVSSTITVGDVPNSIIPDGNGSIWVLSEGKASWTGDETAGKLSKINVSNNAVTSIDFNTTQHPKYLNLQNGSLYYFMSGGVFKMSSTSSTLPTSSEISGLNLYGMVVNNNTLYALDAVDYVSNGKMYVFNLATNSQIKNIETKLLPNAAYFNF